MSLEIDLHLGKRLRSRRRLLGLSQEKLGGMVGVRFQQIQKYESGANRISAARLWQLSEALEVPIGYFYDGLSESRSQNPSPADGQPDDSDEVHSHEETLELITAYDGLSSVPS